MKQLTLEELDAIEPHELAVMSQLSSVHLRELIRGYKEYGRLARRNRELQADANEAVTDMHKAEAEADRLRKAITDHLNISADIPGNVPYALLQANLRLWNSRG